MGWHYLSQIKLAKAADKSGFILTKIQEATLTIGSGYCDCRDSRRFASHLLLTQSAAYPDINSAAVHSSSVVGVHAWKPLTGGRRFLAGQNTLQLCYECGVD